MAKARFARISKAYIHRRWHRKRQRQGHDGFKLPIVWRCAAGKHKKRTLHHPTNASIESFAATRNHLGRLRRSQAISEISAGDLYETQSNRSVEQGAAGENSDAH